MKKQEQIRWPALGRLLWVLGAVTAWYFLPGLALLWLVLAVAPWISVLASGRVSRPWTRADLFLAGFLLTAVVATFLSYDFSLALTKLGYLIAGALLFYALVAQPKANLWAIAALVAVGGGSVSLLFLLTHNWQADPANLAVINAVGLRLMAARPDIPLLSLDPDITPGLMTLALPFAVAVGLRAIRRRHWRQTAGIGVLLIIMGVGFLLTPSRGAWLGAGAGIGLFTIVEGSRFLSNRFPRRQQLILTTSIVFVVALSFLVGLLFWQRWQHVTIASSGRLALFQQTTQLIGDFPITGSGLATFPGLYSQYILVTPFRFFDHSHNLFLNVLLEQSVLGLLFWLGFLVVTAHMLVLALRRVMAWPERLLVVAAGLSFVMVLVHGLVDDPFYGHEGSPLLFLAPALVVAASRRNGVERKRPFSNQSLAKDWAIAGVVVLLLVGGSGVVFRRPLLAHWYANRGALTMARVELADWPTGEWDDGSDSYRLAPVTEQFRRALSFDDDNLTALYRLGLAAMLNREYETAVAHLQPAYDLAPSHHGIAKSLGYSLLWTGRYDAAQNLLAEIPETEQELPNYEWWWEGHNRPELAAHATEMKLRLYP